MACYGVSILWTLEPSVLWNLLWNLVYLVICSIYIKSLRVKLERLIVLLIMFKVWQYNFVMKWLWSVWIMWSTRVGDVISSRLSYSQIERDQLYKYRDQLSRTSFTTQPSQWAELQISGQSQDMLKMILTTAGLLLCVSMVRGRPRTDQDLDSHFERLVRTSCNQGPSSNSLIKKNCQRLKNRPRLNSLKKSVYNFLESKFHKLNKNQQIVVANALINKLFQLRRTLKNSHHPRKNTQDMFARML